MAEPLYVSPRVVRQATGSLRTASAGRLGFGEPGSSVDGASADAAIGRLVRAAGDASSAAALNIVALLLAIDDAVGDTVVADQLHR